MDLTSADIRDFAQRWTDLDLPVKPAKPVLDAVHRANTITTEAQQASAKAAIAAHETAVFIAEGKLTFEQGLDEATHATTYKAAIGPENPVMLGPSLLADALAETFRPARAFLNANVAVLADEGGPGIRGFFQMHGGIASDPVPIAEPEDPATLGYADKGVARTLL